MWESLSHEDTKARSVGILQSYTKILHVIVVRNILLKVHVGSMLLNSILECCPCHGARTVAEADTHGGLQGNLPVGKERPIFAASLPVGVPSAGPGRGRDKIPLLG